MLNFDRSTVKHGTQNIQNDCHQWLSGSFRVHQISFLPGIRPGPNWGSLQRPRPSGLFKGPYFEEGEGGKGEGIGREEWERKGMGWTPPFTNSSIRPWFMWPRRAWSSVSCRLIDMSSLFCQYVTGNETIQAYNTAVHTNNRQII